MAKFEFDRYQTVNWLVTIQRAVKCSDQALFKAIHWADCMLVRLNALPLQSLTRNQKFMILRPQYLYCVGLLLAAKMLDVSYPDLTSYL